MTSPRVMRLFESQLENADVRDFIKSIEAETSEVVQMILQAVGQDVVQFLRSYTNLRRPPRYERKFMLDKDSVRRPVTGDQSRPAHPGGWADVTNELAKGYRYKVELVGSDWRLWITNITGHAVYVEAMDGYFVVSGALADGGPVDRALRLAIKRLAPDWQVHLATGDEVFVSPKSGK